MQEEEEIIIDEWKLALTKKKKELELCQKERGLTTCIQCEKVLECEIRDTYIESVYNSMSKGKGGGFEF